MADNNSGCAGGMQRGLRSQNWHILDDDSDSNSLYISTSEGSTSGFSSTNVRNGYFAMHGITAGPNDDFNSMFNRLAVQEGWSKTDRKMHRYNAIAVEIEGIHGTDSTNLEKWQQLCRDVKIAPVPLSITKCKKALNKVNVNLVNLISHRHNHNIELKLFPTYHALRAWTLGGKKGSRIFPKKLAKEEGFIRVLLKDLRLH